MSHEHLHVHIHLPGQAELSAKLDTILGLLRASARREILMAGELAALESQVAANTDAEASAVILLNKLHEMLTAAGTDPAKLDSLKSQLAASKDALAAAIVANTPQS